MTLAQRDELVRWAGTTIAEGSKSFGMASRLLPKRERENAWLLYAWCRICDDITDGQSLGHSTANTANPNADLWDLTRKAIRTDEDVPPAFFALRIVQRDKDLPIEFIEDHLRGFELDTQQWRPRDLWDLEGYCFHVAGAVGCMMAVLMGVNVQDKATLARAGDLGLAFQLNNIVRDFVDDAQEGRCYIPQEWLAERNLAESDVKNKDARPILADFANDLNHLARRYEVSARVGAARLPYRCRTAILAAANIYGMIGEKVVRCGQDAWNNRVFTSKSEKLGAVGKAIAQSISSPVDAGRAGLFNREDWYTSGRLGPVVDKGI